MHPEDLVVQQVQDLFRGPMGADFFGLGVILCACQGAKQLSRKARAQGEFRHPFHPLERGDGHDAGDNGNVDPGQPAPFAEIVEIAVVEKKLRADVIGAGIDFGLEVLNFLESIGRVGMTFGEPGHPDPHMGKMFFGEGHQFHGVAKVLLGRIPRLLGGRVASQGHDVVDAVFIIPLENPENFIPARLHARQVRHDRQVRLIVQLDDQVMGQLTC